MLRRPAHQSQGSKELWRTRKSRTSSTSSCPASTFITGTAAEDELAGFLGIHPAEIEAAQRLRKIPPDWLVILMMSESILPEWVLTGRGPCCTLDILDGYERGRGEEAAMQRADKEALRRLPSAALAKELVRHIAVAQTDAACRQAAGKGDSTD